MIIDFIKNAPWPVFILVWILIGMIWSDFVLWFQRKFAPNTEFTRLTKNATMVLWPVSFVVFILGFIIGIIKYYLK